MTIEDNKKYKLTGEQIKDLASRISILGAEADGKAEKALSGSTAPTTSTPGEIGQLYIQDDGTIYILKDIIEESGDESGALAQFIWEEFGAGTEYTAGDGINITNDVISATNTGKARVLTTADYNIKSGTWSTSDPTTFDAVALWLMPSGFYSLTDNNLLVYIDRSNRIYNIPSGGKAILVLNAQANNKIILVPSGSSRMYVCYTSEAGYGTEVSGNLDSRTVLTRYEIEDSLTSSDADRTLSAAQGKVLKNFIGDLTNLTTTDKTNLVAAINEAAAGGGGGGIIELTSADYNANSNDWSDTDPTHFNCIAMWLLEPGIYQSSATIGYYCRRWKTDAVSKNPTTWVVQQDYNNTKFFLEIEERYIYNFAVYFSGANAGVVSNAVRNYLDTNVVKQTTGTSTTDVMSQNAVTSMVYDDPSEMEKVRIGKNTVANNRLSVAIGGNANRPDAAKASAVGAVAIGSYANVAAPFSVGLEGSVASGANGGIALGWGSSATSKGQFDVSTTNPSYGYNNSNYRLLTGLYDPQNDHDAATKGYVDNSLLGKQDALTAGSGISIADESGSLVISTTVAEPDEFTSSEWNALWS